MNSKCATFSSFPSLGVVLIGLALLATGCELDGLSSGDGESTGQEAISLAELNGEAESSAPTSTSTSTSTTTSTDASASTPTPTPAPTPAPTPSSNNPRYSPGEIEIPAEFLRHGTMLELRFERCSVANGLMKQKSSTVYSIAPPSDPIWRQTDANGATGIGTRARFADGAVYDGFVKDFNGSYPMPIRASSPWGSAFWARAK